LSKEQQKILIEKEHNQYIIDCQKSITNNLEHEKNIGKKAAKKHLKEHLAFLLSMKNEQISYLLSIQTY